MEQEALEARLHPQLQGPWTQKESETVYSKESMPPNAVPDSSSEYYLNLLGCFIAICMYRNIDQKEKRQKLRSRITKWLKWNFHEI